jgi:signal transduction histidine kinase
MTPDVRRWWRQRSLRARLTLIASACLAVGLAAGGLLLLRGFAASRLHAIDRSARTVADNIAGLAAAGALPETLPVESGQSAQVVDARGGVLAVSPGTLRTLPLLPPDKAASLAGHQPVAVTVDAIDGDAHSRVLVRSVRSGTDTEYVIVAASLRDERDTVAGLSHLLLVVAPLLLLAVAGTLWLLLGRALAAVTDLREAAEAVTDPAAGPRLPLPGSRDEIHALTTTLNAMLDRLAAASLRERAFVADAAHELRSPLASMRTQLEVAAVHPTTTTAEQLAVETLADVERLAQLVDDLLLLARIDAGTPLWDGLVDVGELVDSAGPQPLRVRGDADALARAVDNLRANARRHAATTSRASASAHDGVVDIVVEDDGPGIPPADRERVFERFVRLDDARARDAGGSGLGLAIVRATARAHRGDVHVTDSPLGGAAFVLTLPRADEPAPP